MLTRRASTLLVAFSLGHLLLISWQVQTRSGVPVLKALAFGTFATVQQGLGAVADGGRSFWTNYLALRGAVKENDQLHRRVADLEGQLQQAQAEASHAQAMQRLLDLRATITAPTVAARVIAGDPSPGSLNITIDRGSDDGVAADMAVIGQNGVVGRVINRPLPHAAQVQLLIGRHAAAAVVFERSRAGGIVRGGHGEPTLQVEKVPAAADVKAGDRVLTSGQEGIFPSGFFVGTVVHAERRAGEWQILVQPGVDFSHIDFVLVVLDRTAASSLGRP